MYPWQQNEWQHLLACKNANRLPHALLLHGQAGIGKLQFALELSKLLLCEQATTIACGKCAGCALLQAGNHPDFFLLQAEAEGKIIKIDQIRELIVELASSTQRGGFKIAIIEPADMLNVAAANALLKTLEEPAANTLIILITSQIHKLPATIRSRCQKLAMATPSLTIAKKWLHEQLPDANAELLLALTENAPLQALALATSPFLSERAELLRELAALTQNKAGVVALAEKLVKWEWQTLLTCFMQILHDLMKIKLHADSFITNIDSAEPLRELATNCTTEKLVQLQTELLQQAKLFSANINLNFQLVIENMLILWQRNC